MKHQFMANICHALESVFQYSSSPATGAAGLALALEHDALTHRRYYPILADLKVARFNSPCLMS